MTIRPPDMLLASALRPKELRDEFAMAALSGLLAQNPQGGPAAVFAAAAYVVADTMMEVRKFPPPADSTASTT